MYKGFLKFDHTEKQFMSIEQSTSPEFSLKGEIESFLFLTPKWYNKLFYLKTSLWEDKSVLSSFCGNIAHFFPVQVETDGFI